MTFKDTDYCEEKTHKLVFCCVSGTFKRLFVTCVMLNVLRLQQEMQSGALFISGAELIAFFSSVAFQRLNNKIVSVHSTPNSSCVGEMQRLVSNSRLLSSFSAQLNLPLRVAE